MFSKITCLVLALTIVSGFVIAQEPVVRPKPKKDDEQAAPSKPVREPAEPPVVPPFRPAVAPTKPAEDTGEMGLLPANFIRNRVDNLKSGSASFVGVDAIVVDSKRRCWLYPQALTGTKNMERAVEVRKDLSGYHLTISQTDHQWDAIEMDTTNWIPVKSIAVK